MRGKFLMHYYYDTFIAPPAGDITAVVDENGALVATCFGGLGAATWNAALSAYLAGCGGTLARAPGRLQKVRGQTDEYFSGKRRDFDLPLAPFSGTAHQRRVWSALCAIPFGETRSYGALAKTLGSSPRAVGRANATNLIPLFIPCHRVIGADGALTGFAYGVEIKRRLLKHEKQKMGSEDFLFS